MEKRLTINELQKLPNYELNHLVAQLREETLVIRYADNVEQAIQLHTCFELHGSGGKEIPLYSARIGIFWKGGDGWSVSRSPARALTEAYYLWVTRK